MIPDLVNAFVWINICLYRTLYVYRREGGRGVPRFFKNFYCNFHIDRVEGGTKVLGPWHPPSNFLPECRMKLIFTPFDSEWRKEWENIFFLHILIILIFISSSSGPHSGHQCLILGKIQIYIFSSSEGGTCPGHQCMPKNHLRN